MSNLETSLAACREKLTEMFGDNLISLTVYGSAASRDYLEGLSDINLVLVLRQIDLETLDRMRVFTKRMRRHRLASPLLMTKEHIQTSQDVFPIEFLEIQERHRVLWGEDYFGNLTIATANLRHECEHELKGRLIRLRESYLEAGHKQRLLRDLILTAHGANFPAFRTAIRLRGQVPPVTRDEIEEKVCSVFGLEIAVFQEIRRLRLKRCDESLSSLRRLLDHYLIEVEKLAQAVDAL